MNLFLQICFLYGESTLVGMKGINFHASYTFITLLEESSYSYRLSFNLLSNLFPNSTYLVSGYTNCVPKRIIARCMDWRKNYPFRVTREYTKDLSEDRYTYGYLTQCNGIILE